MADVGTVLTIAQTLFAALECSSLKEFLSVQGYNSDLEDLKLTVSTITKVLLDAEAKQEFSHEEQDWIEKLQQAVYDADDLFDELLTLAKQKEQKAGGKVFEEVCDFFSSNNKIKAAYTISRRVKKIRKKLDALADNHRKFGFVINSQPIRRRAESCSYAYVGDVVGREDDLKAVLHMLLDSDDRDDVGFLTIVGVGGLGKTTLAQLLYHDERIKNTFPLRLWACVSDQEREDFDVNTILTKVVESATSKKHDGFGMDLLQSELQTELTGKKFLLVLDDVWTEDRYKWLDLRKFLVLGGRGSRVVVTTRSIVTASIIGTEQFTYELEGLSKVNSWRLFEMTAFGMGHNQDFPHELVEIGENIVENCHNSPLAIKVIGSLLFGQDVRKWRSIQESGQLTKIRQGNNEILSILKLSYHNLESSLKSCFRYCALFPKDHVIYKRKLISLWMAQQYIIPFDGGQSIEDAGEEYFSILLRRCFFQDAEKDEYGEVYSCKIHDLMHDVAQAVAGKEFCFVDSISSNLADTTRHLFHVGNTCVESFSKLKIRSYLRDGYNQFQVSSLFASWRCLRVLDLHDLDIKSLPDSLGQLLHLRYLDLSENTNLKALPNSITKLYHLQTLNVNNCESLCELPMDLNKLVNLRCLLNKGLVMLFCMPPGVDKLTGLHTLSAYVVSKEKYGKQSVVGQLNELRKLKNLRGSIDISIRVDAFSLWENDSEGGFLRSMEHLKEVSIKFWGCYSGEKDYTNAVNFHESLLENMQPHFNLKVFNLNGFQGAGIPRWGKEWSTSLPNLVKIKLEGCHGLQILPSLSKLCHLKSLELRNLCNLEYIENSSIISDDSAVSAPGSMIAELTFFPSLKYLNIDTLPKLKGWWKVANMVTVQPNDSSHILQPSFLNLSALFIDNCRELRSFPPCPSLEQLGLMGVDRQLQTRIDEGDIGLFPSLSTSSLMLQSDKGSSLLKLKNVALSNPDHLKLIAVEHLISMSIVSAPFLKSLSEVGEIFKNCSSLRNLKIIFCFQLKCLSGGLEYLTALESLSFHGTFKVFSTTEDDDDDDVLWSSLNLTLRSLELSSVCHPSIPPKKLFLPKGFRHLTNLRCLRIVYSELIELPEWISCLSSLQSLSIVGCEDLKSLPNAFRMLFSLQRLEIRRCSKMFARRCRNPEGEDWPKIQHIPSISINESFEF